MDEIDWYIVLHLFFLNLSFKLAYIKLFPIGADSFHFLNNANTKFYSGEFLYDISQIMNPITLTIVVFCIGLFIIPLFYAFCRRWIGKPYATLSTVFLIISPLFFYQTQYNWVDKNNICFIFIIIAYWITFYKTDTLKNEIVRIIVLGLWCLIFNYFWAGFILLPIICYIILLVKYLKEKNKILSGTIIGLGVLLIILKYKVITGLIAFFTMVPEKFFISELVSPLAMPIKFEYFILFGLIFALFKPYLVKKYKYLFLLYLMTLMGFIVGYRLSIFFIPIAYLWVGILLSSYKPIKACIIAIPIIILVLITGQGMYNATQDMSKDMLPIFEHINNDPRHCLISVWDKGYMFEYYTNKQIQFKASGAEYQLNYQYFLNNTPSDCIKVFTDKDIDKFIVMMRYDKLPYNKEDFQIFKDGLTYIGGDYYSS